MPKRDVCKHKPDISLRIRMAAARNFAVQLKGRVLGEERTDRSSGWIWADLYIVGLEERSRMGGSIRGLFLFDWRRAVIASSSFSSCHVLALILKSDGGAVQCTVKTTSSEGQLSYLYFVVNGECFFTCVKIQRPPTIALSVGGHTSYTDGTVTLPAGRECSGEVHAISHKIKPALHQAPDKRWRLGGAVSPWRTGTISVQPMPVLIIRRHLNSPTLTLAGSWKCAARVRTALSALACPVVSSPAPSAQHLVHHDLLGGSETSYAHLVRVQGAALPHLLQVIPPLRISSLAAMHSWTIQGTWSTQ
ncbi:hypothetical protein C8R43DRAFT_1204129 [Mycena crocata]|nr:hypothetical protein C8R43DRAFT_1204129 [Mycena crocata]